MDDDWVYQDEEFNEDLPYVEVQLGIDDLYLVYDSVKYRYEKWPGGHPEEQARLAYLRDFMYRIVLEYKFQMD